MEKKQFNIYLPPDLIKKFRLKCVEKEITMSECVEELITEWCDVLENPIRVIPDSIRLMLEK